MAGKDWFHNFMQRNGLVLRRAEHTSQARAEGFNKQSVSVFFYLLESLQNQYSFSASDIYNVDECGVSVNPKCSHKVVAIKGQRQVGGLVALERGRTVTVEMCMSAAGQFMPQMVIFPLVKENKEYLVGAPDGAWAVFDKGGWMTINIFIQWFKKFIEFSGASLNRKKLLILDGHVSHVKGLEVIDLANKNGIIILTLPPHSTHRLQPLDVGYMKPFSTAYAEEIRVWQKDNGPVKMKNIFYLMGQAFVKVCKMETAVNAFKKTGIFPLNRHVFKDSDFANIRNSSQLNSRVTIGKLF